MTEADEHLRSVDHVLRGLIDEGGPIDPETDRRGSRPDAYQALARAIVGQQLSTKAAASIWGRVTELFDDETPAPAQLIEADGQALRDAGLSWSKVGFLKDLAERVEDGRLDLDHLSELSDEDVVATLTEIKGIGRWTAEMFLIFHLGRPDVISTGDLGIRRATQIAYGLDELPGPTELERIAEPWRPAPDPRLPLPLALPPQHTGLGLRTGAAVGCPDSTSALREVTLKKRLLAGTPLALAAGSLAPGCGRGDDTTTVSGPSGATGAQGAPLTKDAFLAKANEICNQGGQQLDQDAQKFFKSVGLSGNQAPSSDQIQQFANETAIPHIQAQITAIEALPAPSGDEDQVTAITDSAQQALDKIKADPSLLENNGKNDPFVDADNLAKDYGLDECAN